MPLQKLSIAFVYDTSFLMGDREFPFVPDDWLVLVDDEAHLVPDLVLGELEGHLKGDLRDKAAAARGKLNDAGSAYQEVCVPKDMAEEVPQIQLGADSIVDRALIGYALQVVQAGTYDGVCILTNDGGIHRSVQKIANPDLTSSRGVGEEESDMPLAARRQSQQLREEVDRAAAARRADEKGRRFTRRQGTDAVFILGLVVAVFGLDFVMFWLAGFWGIK